MSEKSPGQVPHPEVDARATRFAATEARRGKLHESLVAAQKQSSALSRELSDKLAEHASKSFIGKAIGNRALHKLAEQADAADQHFSDLGGMQVGVLNRIGQSRNAAAAAKDFRDNNAAYHENAVALAEAEGVRINVQQPQEAAQIIPVHVAEQE